MDELNDFVRQVAEVKEADFVKKGSATDLSEVEAEIFELVNFARILRKNSSLINSIPASSRPQLLDDLRNVINQYNAVQSFDIKNYPNPVQNFVNERVAEIRAIHQRLFQYISYVLSKDLGAKLSGRSLDKAEEQVTGKLSEIEGKAKEAAEVLEGIKKSGTRLSLGKYQKIFDDEAKTNRTQAIVWGKWLIGVSLVTAGGVFYVLLDKLPSLDPNRTGDFVAFLLLKLFGVTVLIYILQLVARNYFALMHQWSLNKHRRNVLGVFDAVVEAGTSPEVKDTVLTLMSKAIFDSGDTGFISGKDMSHDGPDYIQFARDMARPGR